MVGVGCHNHYTNIYRHVLNSRFDLFVFQSLSKTFSSASPPPDIQPYLSTRRAGQTRLANSQAATMPPLPTHLPTNNSSTTKLGVLSLPLPTPPPPPSSLNYAFYFPPLLPPIGFQQNVPMVAHSTPIEFPHLQQIYTQALAENHTHPQHSAHILQLHCSHILNPSHSPRVS